MNPIPMRSDFKKFNLLTNVENYEISDYKEVAYKINAR